MKTLPSGMQAHLDSGATTLAWCWRIELRDGTVLGFTDHDQTLSFGGVSYEPESGMTASELRSSSDMAVDAHEAQGAISSTRITETDILSGRWDNASVEIWRVNWSNVAQRVLMRRGVIGQIRRGRVAFVAEVRSMTHALDQTIGRTYQAWCDANVGDERCKVNLNTAAFRAIGTVASVIGDRTITVAAAGTFAAGWFSLGTVEFTSGALTGRKLEIAVHDGTRIVMREPFTVAPAVGNGVIVRAGCDKRITTCAAKFSNVANFRGFPHIPGDDAVVRYATRDGNHQGGVL